MEDVVHTFLTLAPDWGQLWFHASAGLYSAFIGLENKVSTRAERGVQKSLVPVSKRTPILSLLAPYFND